MRPDDDDGEEMGNGPPPDPSLRSWRHPSEIASAEAAAARPFRPTRSSIPPPTGRLAALAVAGGVVAVLAAMGLYAFGSSLLTAGLGPVNEYGSAKVTSRSMLRSDQFPHSLAPATTRSAPHQPSSTSRSVAQNPTPEPTSSNASSMAGQSELARTWPTVEQGIFAKIDGAPLRLAAFTLIDGLVFTSAAAIEGYDTLTIAFGQLSAGATVVGTDDVSDLAVLSLDEPDARALGLAMSAAPELTTVEGSVVGRDDRTMTRRGSTVYGSLLTSTSCPEGIGGSPLVDESGAVVGVVINSAGPLISALPIAEVIAIGHSFLTWHTASLAWLGVDGNTQADGGVKLTGVSSGSPAAAVHLLIGDRIRTINGTKVIDWNHLVHLVRQAGTGATVEVGLERDNSEAVVQVTIGSRLDSPQ